VSIGQGGINRCAFSMLKPLVLRAFACVFAVAAGLITVRLAAAEDDVNFAQTVQPLLKKYCYDCHGGKETHAELNLTRYQASGHVLEGRKVWQSALAKVRAREMPPEDAPSQPTAAERARLAEGLEKVLASLDCNGSPNPGRVTLRRLTRYEYRNSVRDLTGIDYPLADDFPADDTGYGFDNIGDVLSLPPILFEKYLDAAERIAAKAIVIPPVSKEQTTVVGASDMKVERGRVDDAGLNRRALMNNATLSHTWTVDRGGQYELSVEGGGDQAGPEAPRMAVLLDGKQLKVFDVKNNRHKGKLYAIKQRLSKRQHTVSISFLNDYYNPDKNNRPKGDRNLIVYNLRITRVPPAMKLPASHKRIITATPDEHTTRKQASEKVLRRLASWAYRRPVTESELARLVALTQQAEADGESYEAGIRLALTAILVSPHFIYKVELDPPGKEGAPRNLNDFEVATRLSYFLWNSSPDAELMTHAKNKSLLNGDNLAKQTRRLLQDIRSKALVENFVGQWLELRDLEDHQPDAATFPAYDARLRFAIRRETELFIWTILHEDRSVVDLLAADFTFVNGPLAELYGISGIEGDEFKRVSTAGRKRGGLLTQASFLTVTSNPNRTSPVKRGKFILDNLLGAPLPPPPPNVPEFKPGRLAGSLRQQMEQHRTNSLCASCHERMDPLGFALENYDGIGRWRDNDGGQRVDASGKLPTGEQFSGPDDLRRVLLARKDEFVKCLAEKLLTYALGRGLEYYDQCAVETIVREVKTADYRFSSLALEIVRSDPFLKTGGKRDPR
jgi:hypothetical protein